MSLSDTRSDVRLAAGCLQPALTDLVELQAQAKQLHWSVVGPGFGVLHPALDAIAATAATQADGVAERMRALGGVPNGRTADVAASTTLVPVPMGEVAVGQAAAHVVRALGSTVAALVLARGGIEALDATSVDVLNAAILTLEKHAWLIAAEGYGA